MSSDKPIYEKLEWIETTVNEDSKISQDMFISESRGKFTLVVVKDGEIDLRVDITISEASRFQRLYKLEMIESAFPGCCTYRTAEASALINRLLEKSRAG